jgi:hypothetical protein
MRFLADAGVSPKTVEFLKQLGHEAVHVRTLGLQRAGDPQLVERAGRPRIEPPLPTRSVKSLTASSISFACSQQSERSSTKAPSLTTISWGKHGRD